MTRVSFYVLKSSIEHDRYLSACRLTEKAFNQGNHIYIYVENAEQA
jgi:DNA polymerase IIIc chi subunit